MDDTPTTGAAPMQLLESVRRYAQSVNATDAHPITFRDDQGMELCLHALMIGQVLEY